MVGALSLQNILERQEDPLFTGGTKFRQEPPGQLAWIHQVGPAAA